MVSLYLTKRIFYSVLDWIWKVTAVVFLSLSLHPSSCSPETNDDLLLLCDFGHHLWFIHLQLHQIENVDELPISWVYRWDRTELLSPACGISFMSFQLIKIKTTHICIHPQLVWIRLWQFSKPCQRFQISGQFQWSFSFYPNEPFNFICFGWSQHPWTAAEFRGG